MVGVAAEHLAQAQQQGGTERHQQRRVDDDHRRHEQPDGLRAQVVGQHDGGPAVRPGRAALRAPAAVPGFGRAVYSALRRPDHAAAGAGLETLGWLLLTGEPNRGAAPAGRAEVDPSDVDAPQDLHAELVVG